MSDALREQFEAWRTTQFVGPLPAVYDPGRFGVAYSFDQVIQSMQAAYAAGFEALAVPVREMQTALEKLNVLSGFANYDDYNAFNCASCTVDAWIAQGESQP